MGAQPADGTGTTGYGSGAEENREVVKKARFTPTEAQALEELAEERETTQSEILRAGVRALLRVERRRENIGKLIDLLPEDPHEPDKIPFEPGP